MSELTLSRMEDGVASANSFLGTQRGVELDGAQAQARVTELVMMNKIQAEQTLTAHPYPKHDGFYVPLGKHNAGSFTSIAASLAGRCVLVPSAMLQSKTSDFYPAIVSEDGIKSGNMRLHVLKQPYRKNLSAGASMILSAAGQSETKGVGEHNKTENDGLEAEHFATLLVVGTDRRLIDNWRQGNHINHTWRNQRTDSVTSEVSARVFGSEIEQSTITITKEQAQRGQAVLLWHEGMRDEQGNPEAATRKNALVVFQGLGFQAVKETTPSAIDTVKGLIA